MSDWSDMGQNLILFYSSVHYGSAAIYTVASYDIRLWSFVRRENILKWKLIFKNPKYCPILGQSAPIQVQMWNIRSEQEYHSDISVDKLFKHSMD